MVAVGAGEGFGVICHGATIYPYIRHCKYPFSLQPPPPSYKVSQMRNQLKIYLLILFVAFIVAGVIRSCSIAYEMRALHNEPPYEPTYSEPDISCCLVAQVDTWECIRNVKCRS